MNGQDALTQIKLEKLALILMDATRPRMDGWEAARRAGARKSATR